MKEFKGTKGDFSIQRISGIVTGICVSKKMAGGTYTEIICDFILPDTDEEYEESNIEDDARLLVSSKHLLEALQELIHLHSCEQEGLSSGQPTREMWLAAYNKGVQAIYKALGE